MTEEKRNTKKIGSELKTFTVHFALEEIKENITFTSNTPYKPSKEKIINQAFNFHLEGNISEALKYYKLSFFNSSNFTNELELLYTDIINK